MVVLTTEHNYVSSLLTASMLKHIQNVKQIQKKLLFAMFDVTTLAEVFIERRNKNLTSTAFV